jgi:hypothetical protein
MNQEETRCDWCEREATNQRAGERFCDGHLREVDECKQLASDLKGHIGPSLLEWSLAKVGEGYQGWQTYDATVTVGNELSEKGAREISKEVAARQQAERGESMVNEVQETQPPPLTAKCNGCGKPHALFVPHLDDHYCPKCAHNISKHELAEEHLVSLIREWIIPEWLEHYRAQGLDDKALKNILEDFHLSADFGAYVQGEEMA